MRLLSFDAVMLESDILSHKFYCHMQTPTISDYRDSQI